MKRIENNNYELERSLYGLKNMEVINCYFKSDLGESPLKETADLVVSNCQFEMRYPLWHTTNTKVLNSQFLITSRAPFWYDSNLTIDKCQLEVVKALRECEKVLITNSNIESSEFGWNTFCVRIIDSSIKGEYAFLNSNDLELTNVLFGGKYSFQYVKNVTIRDSILDTKDAFWHSENVTVINCVIKGEYLGWYSKNLHLINCTIDGTQPLCYAQNLEMIGCRMQNCDLAFEYTSGNIEVTTPIISVKNPLSGTISAPSIGEVIFDENRRGNDVLIKQNDK